MTIVFVVVGTLFGTALLWLACSRLEHVMMLLYLGFGVWMTLEAFGVTSVLGVRGGGG